MTTNPDFRPNDQINPDHYKAADGSQVIDVIELYEMDFHTGNAIKYILRAGRKPFAPAITDLDKAIWYLQRKRKLISDAMPEGSSAAEKAKPARALSGGMSRPVKEAQ